MNELNISPKPLRNKINKQQLKKGIYVLPSLLTLGSLFCSFLAMIQLMLYFKNQTYLNFYHAIVLLIFATLLDTFDGKLAGLTNTSTEFGKHLDSLADAISFGLAPAFLVFVWALHSLGRMGWIASAVFLTCGVSRLARFNTQVDSVDRRFFIGLPIPAASAVLITTALNFYDLPQQAYGPYLIWAMTMGLAYMMVSRFHYRTFKEIDVKEKFPIRVVLTMALIILFCTWKWMETLLVITYAYLLSGLIAKILPKQWDWKRVGLDPASLEVVLDEAIGLDEDDEHDLQ